MTDDDTPTYYVNGEEVEIHGAKLARGTTTKGKVYPDLTSLIIRFPDNVQTREVPAVVVKVEGGLSAMMDDLSDRGVLPEWYTDGERLPPEHPNRDDE